MRRKITHGGEALTTTVVFTSQWAPNSHHLTKKVTSCLIAMEGGLIDFCWLIMDSALEIISIIRSGLKFS